MLFTRFFLILSLLITTSLFSLTKIPEIDGYEVQLPNGIVVFLKPIENTEDILIRGIAPEGYSVLPLGQRASGKLAADIAWESGIGSWTGDELAHKLMADSIELETKLTPFSRTIEGMVGPARLEEVLQVIQQLYVAPRFEPSSVGKVIKRLGDSVQLRHQDPETLFEDVILSTNTSDLAVLHPVTKEDLENVDFETAKAFYLQHYLSTDNLKFIIVGEFDVNAALPLVEKYLGGIPQKSAPKAEELSLKMALPPGINKREVVSKKLTDCLARVTFPLDLELTESSWQQLEIAAQVIETRLRSRFQTILGSTQGIDVAYEFPYYPHSSPSWLTLQFRCPGCKSEQVIQLIVAELQRLRTEGPTLQEVEKVRRQQECSDEFWIQHKRYWTGLISNYYLWRWDLRGAIKNYKTSPFHKPELVAQFINKHLSLNNYTIVILKPR